jgi:hypothetical protein
VKATTPTRAAPAPGEDDPRGRRHGGADAGEDVEPVEPRLRGEHHERDAGQSGDDGDHMRAWHPLPEHGND